MPLENLLDLGLFFVFIFSLSLAVCLIAHFRGGIKVHLLHTICAFLGLWSLGLLFVRVADTYQEAFFWQRFSALGWTAIYSFLLHFFLVFTQNRFLKKWWLYPLIYFPAFLNLLVFSLLPGFAGATQELLRMGSSWVVLPRLDFWNWFFNLYCISFVILSVALLLKEANKLKELTQRKQLFLIAFSLLFALALGFLGDRIFSPKYLVGFSNLAPLIALFPITVIAILFRKQREFLEIKRQRFSQEVAKGEILSEKEKFSFYIALAGAHVLGSFLYVVFSLWLLDRSLHTQVLRWGTYFFFVGMGIYYLSFWETSEKKRDLGLSVALSLSAFLVFFRIAPFLREEPLFSLPLWLFLLPTVFLGNFGAFVIVAVSLTSFQVWTWFEVLSLPTFSSFMVLDRRLLVSAVFALSVLIAFYMRYVYLRNLEEERTQLEIQQTLVRLSSQLVKVHGFSLEESLKSFLHELLQSYHMDCGAFWYSTGEGYQCCELHLDDKILGPNFGDSFELGEEVLSALREIAKREQIFVVHDVKELPPQVRQFIEPFERRGMRSGVLVPIQSGGKLLGALVLASFSRRQISTYWQNSLKILNNFLTDVLERLGMEFKLQRLAFYDVLTELPNRALFMDRLQKALQRAKRTGKSLAVVFVDLDSFKLINDSEGHEIGDQLLREIAQRLSASLREYDTVARFGGDEFLILVEELGDAQELVPILERLIRGLKKPFRIEKQEFFIAASCGVALYPFDGEDPEELIRAADLAMYNAKSRGGDGYALCSYQLKEEAQKRKTLVSGLYRALDREELILYYQPQVDASTGNVLGVEALLRWRHPELGLLLPGSFISLAEQTGLMVSIGEWVLRTACSQLVAWQRKGLRIDRVSVNLSSTQLRDFRLIDKVRKVVEEVLLFPDNLELEITESAIFQDPDEVIALLEELKKLGVRIALDDFGIGYSSLIRLKMLPIDRIKVDRRFFEGVPSNRQDAAIVESIIQLARSINVAVIAEGVENGQQLEFVVERGCYEIQGYYYYHPLPPQEIEALLRGERNKRS